MHGHGQQLSYNVALCRGAYNNIMQIFATLIEQSYHTRSL